MMRDPNVDPKEGDVVYISVMREAIVQRVSDGWVYYRVTDDHRGLMVARRTPIGLWREVLSRKGS